LIGSLVCCALSIILILVCANGGRWSSSSNCQNYAGAIEDCFFGLTEAYLVDPRGNYDVSYSTLVTEYENDPTLDPYVSDVNKLKSAGLCVSAFIGLGVILAVFYSCVSAVIYCDKLKVLHKFHPLLGLLYTGFFIICFAVWAGVASQALTTLDFSPANAWSFDVTVIAWILSLFSVVAGTVMFFAVTRSTANYSSGSGSAPAATKTLASSSASQVI